jgi:hypothetical protein
MKEFKYCYMSKADRLPEGFYKFTEPNIWHPVIYLRKAKGCTEEEYQIMKDIIKDK